MKNFVICGDVHFKREPDSPYNKGLEKLFDYLIKTYNEHIFIYTGDFFDTPSVHWSVYEKAYNILRRHPKEVFINTGNHDLNNIKGNSLLPLDDNKKIHIIEEFCIKNIESYKVAFLPYLNNISKMREYESIQDSVDFSVSHISPPGMNFSSPDEIEIKFKSRISHVYGHIHNTFEFENEYGKHIGIGSPQTTRNGEQNYEKVIAVIEDDVIHLDKLPVFFTIEDVVYGDKPKDKSNIINIINAPSIELAKEKYSEFNIRKDGIKLLRTEIEDAKEKMESSINSNLETKFLKYAKENDISEQVTNVIIEALREVNNL